MIFYAVHATTKTLGGSVVGMATVQIEEHKMMPRHMASRRSQEILHFNNFLDFWGHRTSWIHEGMVDSHFSHLKTTAPPQHATETKPNTVAYPTANPTHLLQGLGHLLHSKGGHEPQGPHGEGDQGGYRAITQDGARPQDSAIPP